MEANRTSTIYTIGHSNHEFARFVDLLRLHGVTDIADVRSQPFSRFEQFRHGNLKALLNDAGVGYVFLGQQLGARRDEPECYVDGCVVYSLVAKLPAFREGIARVERGAGEHVIALMCAEREPLDCHRTVLVSRTLSERGWDVRHILADGTLEPHAETERRMINAVGLDPLFDGERSEQELKRRAYAERGWEIAYNPGDEDPNR